MADSAGARGPSGARAALANSIGRTSRTGLARRKRAGVAAVEFAVCVPLFLLLIIGVIEFGRALMVQQVLTNASRVGARSAVTSAATVQQVVDAVNEYTSSVAVPDATVVVSPSPSAAATGDPITVTVSVAFQDVSWLPAPWFLGSTTLTASSVMRKEGFE